MAAAEPVAVSGYRAMRSQSSAPSRYHPAPAAHGFGPIRQFDLVSHSTDSCLLRLKSDAETRTSYPFDFELDAAFHLQARALRQTAHVTNTGAEIMAASVGFHPGFAWPLPAGTASSFAKEDHVLVFDQEEPSSIRRLTGGLLSARTFASPINGQVLALSEELFRDGALILDRLASKSVWFGVPAQSGLQIDFPDMPHLGLWMVPGGRFLCIEP